MTCCLIEVWQDQANSVFWCMEPWRCIYQTFSLSTTLYSWLLHLTKMVSSCMLYSLTQCMCNYIASSCCYGERSPVIQTHTVLPRTDTVGAGPLLCQYTQQGPIALSDSTNWLQKSTPLPQEAKGLSPTSLLVFEWLDVLIFIDRMKVLWNFFLKYLVEFTVEL